MANYANIGIPTSTPSSALPQAGQSFVDAQAAANKGNELRYQQGLGLWDKIAGIYNFGGAYEQSAMSSYAAGKRQTLAGAAKSAIGSGTYNTTTTAGMGARYEQDIGSPYRLNVAAEQARGKAGALQGTASWVGAKNENAPDPRLFAELSKGASRYSSSYGQNKPLESMSGYYGGSSAPVSSGGYKYSTGGQAPSYDQPQMSPLDSPVYGGAYGTTDAQMSYAEPYSGPSLGEGTGFVGTQPIQEWGSEEDLPWYEEGITW